MATAILSSRNSFDHESLVPRNPNSRLIRHSYAATTAPRRHKRSPAASNTNPVMGQVRILKRGETLSAFRKSCADRDDKKRPVLRSSEVDLLVASTKRIGPEAETVQKQIGAFKGLEFVFGDYAGACGSVSPPPSSVPIPCFLWNK